jgi:hypothetical protein
VRLLAPPADRSSHQQGSGSSLSAGDVLSDQLGDHQVRRGECRHRLLLVEQLLDPAQRAAQRLRVGAGLPQRQRGLELRSDGIRYGLQRFRCISLHSAALQCARCAID